MSVKVMSLVWDTELPPNLRLVLLAYADHANDDGASIYPGEDRLIVKTGYGVSSIRHITAELIRLDLLVQTKKGHRGQRAEYRVDVAALAAIGCKDCTLCGGKGAKNHAKGCKDRVERVQPTAPQTSLNHHEPSLREEGGASLAKPHFISSTDFLGTEEPVAMSLPHHSHRPVVKERKRDELWDMFTQIHGDPATKTERGKYNHIVKQLRDAKVTPDEYPSLVAAYVRKHDGLQPAAATIANRVGELRHYRDRGPVTVPDEAEARNQEAMRKALE